MNYFNDKISCKPCNINDDGLYCCSECGAIFQKVYNIHNDKLYRLQCPNDREHCNPKNNLKDYEVSRYDFLQGIRRCPVCDSVLVYDAYERKLVCQNDENHCSAIKISKEEASRKGYLPKC